MSDNNSKKPFEPTIKPIRTVDDFNNWHNLEWVTDASKALVPRATRIPPHKDYPGSDKDGPSSMAGFDNGPWQYDPWFTQWSQGGHGQSADGNRTAANVYNFSFWQYLDVCYYFGHDLLTIPPTVWTNAAHKNGVYCLGTLCLDSLQTEQDKDRPVLEFVRNVADVSHKMYDIAFYFNFDGYLVNYEYYDENSAQIARHICRIMEELSQEKKLMVVWYDSPISGNGTYQNRLTDSARDFFFAARRFQSNYSWGSGFPGTENYPYLSWKLLHKWLAPRNSVTMMLDCYKRPWRDTRPYYTDYFFSALACVMSGERPAYYTSLGCYAPGWIAFNGLSKNTEKLRDRDRFHQNDRAFWAGTADFQREGPPPDFPPDGPPINPWPEQCMAHYVEERSVVEATPFVTTFNTGEGDFYYIDGKKWAGTPWNNLSDQSVLPTWQFHETGPAHGKAEIDYADAFTGGSRILITGSAGGNQRFVRFMLYKTNVVATETQILSLTVKPPGRDKSLVYGMFEVNGHILPLSNPKKREVNGWTQLDFHLPLGLPTGKPITAIGIAIANFSDSIEDFSISLGKLALLDSAHMPPNPPQNLSMQPDEAGMLNWSKAYQPGSHYRIYGVLDGAPYLLGVVYNYVYSTYKTIFYTDVKPFTSYVVQEVNSAGQYTAL